MTEENTPALIAEIKNLQGDKPKLLGYDYFHVIYATATALCLSMAWVHYTVHDAVIKNMVLVQGLLSLGLIGSAVFYRWRVDSQQKTTTSVAQQPQQADSAD